MPTLSNSNKILLQLDYFLAKQAAQEIPVSEIEREPPLAGPEAEKFKFEDKPVFLELKLLKMLVAVFYQGNYLNYSRLFVFFTLATFNSL